MNSETLTTLVSNNHKFTGTYNNLLNFGGDVPDGTSDGIHDTDLDSNTGLHDHWREYDSWNTTGSSVTSSSNIFTSTTTGVTVLKRGYYRCAITLHLQCVANNVTVASRIAKK